MMEFFHVARNDIESYIGDYLKLYPWEEMECIDKYYNISQINSLKLKYPNGLSNLGQMVLFPSSDVKENKKTLKKIHFEKIFEEVRELFFPNKPSRYCSLFACTNLMDAEEMKIKYFSNNGDIYRVESNNYFISDMNLTHIGKSNEEIYNSAKKYWNRQFTNPFNEALLEFPIKIISKI